MGKMIRFNKRQGWIVWPTPYWFHVSGVHTFKRWQFKGAGYAHNRRRRPLPRS